MLQSLTRISSSTNSGSLATTTKQIEELGGRASIARPQAGADQRVERRHRPRPVLWFACCHVLLPPSVTVGPLLRFGFGFAFLLLQPVGSDLALGLDVQLLLLDELFLVAE